MIFCRAWRLVAESREVSAVNTVGENRRIFFASSGSPGAALPPRLCIPEMLVNSIVNKSRKEITNLISTSWDGVKKFRVQPSGCLLSKTQAKACTLNYAPPGMESRSSEFNLQVARYPKLKLKLVLSTTLPSVIHRLERAL